MTQENGGRQPSDGTGPPGPGDDASGLPRPASSPGTSGDGPTDRTPKAASGRAVRRDRDAKQRSARSSFIERVARAGFRNTRIEDVCRDVGVSHREFYRWFGNKDQCYLSIFDTVGRSLVDVGQRAFDETTGIWEAKLRAGLVAALRKLAGDPYRAPFLLECHAVGGGEGAMWRLVDSAERVYLTDEVRSRPPQVPAKASESVAVGVVVEPIRRYLEEGKVDRLADLVPWIVYYMTLYLFGPARAAGQRPPSAYRARDER